LTISYPAKASPPASNTDGPKSLAKTPPQWIQDQNNDETKFPNDDNEAEALGCFKLRRLRRFLMAPHLNTCSRHFMFFCTEFGLLPKRDMEPLEVSFKPARKQYHLAKGK
jgi:MOB kinase activator 1